MHKRWYSIFFTLTHYYTVRPPHLIFIVVGHQIGVRFGGFGRDSRPTLTQGFILPEHIQLLLPANRKSEYEFEVRLLLKVMLVLYRLYFITMGSFM